MKIKKNKLQFNQDALNTMKQRCAWLTERIKAKKKIKWDVEWDTKERDALAWATKYLELFANTELYEAKLSKKK